MRQSRRLWVNRILILLIVSAFSLLLCMVLFSTVDQVYGRFSEKLAFSVYRIENAFDAANETCIQEEWEANPFGNTSVDFGRTYRVAFSDVQKNYEWLYLPANPLPNHEILMMIISNCDNFARRNVIRRTWMNGEKNKIVAEGRLKALFLVGINGKNPNVNRIVMEEAKLFGDMVVVNMEDSYLELTYKTITAFLYAVNKSPSTKLIGKIDEDVLFFPDQLYPLLKNGDILLNSSSVYGYLYYPGHEINHNPNEGKWYIPFDVLNCPFYPDYVAGPSYFTTRIAAEQILRATKHRKFITVEDGFITGVLAGDVGAKKIYLPNVYAVTDPSDEFLAWHTLKSNMEYEEVWDEYSKKRCYPCVDHARNTTRG